MILETKTQLLNARTGLPAANRVVARTSRNVEIAEETGELRLRFSGPEGEELMRRINESQQRGNLSVVVWVSPTNEDGAKVAKSVTSTKVLPAPVATEAEGESERVVVGPLTIIPHRHEALLNDKPLPALTRTQFGILTLLARHPGWVFGRDRIVALVQGSDYGVTTRAVDVQIVNLRKKLGKAAELIETVRGVGYRLRDVRKS